MSPFGEKPINFSLRVIATDLPLNDSNFKIKVSMDFIPDFVIDAERTNPNFNGRKVTEIMNFITDEVIRKVMEYVYYDRSNKGADQGVKFDEAIEVYDSRAEKIKEIEAYTKSTEQKEAAKEEARQIGEDKIQSIVSELMKSKKYGKKEKDVTSIRYEQLSKGITNVSIQTTVNGEKRPPNTAQSTVRS